MVYNEHLGTYIALKSFLVNSVKKIIAIIAGICLFLQSFTAAKAEETEKSLKEGQLYGKSAVLMDAENGRILFEKNAEEKLAMASTTKIMTCILALETGNLDDMVTISKYAAGMPKVHLGVREGEQYRLKDLLYSLMLESHNDVAVAIAEHIGGSVAGFAKMMNQKARDVGAYNTSFVTPNGLDAEEHYTTAKDLARIARYAIENEQLVEIINTQSYAFESCDGKRNFQISNKNAFLSQMEGAFGIKTGFTGNAGYCFVGALKRDGKTFISVVLASGWPPNRNYKWSDTQKLMEFGLQEYEEKKLLTTDYDCPEITVNGGIGFSKVKTEIRQEVSLLMKGEEQAEIREKTEEAIEAPVKKGQIAGYLEVLIDDKTYCVIPLYATKNIERISFSYLWKKIVEKYTL